MSVERTVAGLALYDDFESYSLGNASGQGGWITRLGAGPPNHDMDLGGPHTIIAGQSLQIGTQGAFHRLHNEAATALNQILEARMRIPDTDWMGLRFCLQPGVTNTDYELVFKSGSNDGIYRSNASSPTLLTTWTTSPTFLSNTWVRPRVRFTTPGGVRTLQVWMRSDDLSSDVVLFDGTLAAGPTTAGYPGITSFNSLVECDWFSVYGSDPITVTGLTGTQGFRVYNAAGSVIASSAAQSGGSATVDLAAVTSSPHTGYLQVFDDAGTWADPVGTSGRYPSSGNATDLSNGDTFLYTPAPPGAFIQIDWDDSGDWGQDHADILGCESGQLAIVDYETIQELAYYDYREAPSWITYRDPTRIIVPGKASSILYPNVALNKRIRVMESDGAGGFVSEGFGVITRYQPQLERGGISRIEWQSYLGLLATFTVILPAWPAGTAIYDGTSAGTIDASALVQLLELFQDEIPELTWDIDWASGLYPDLPQDYGGVATTFGAALAQLATWANAVWWPEPVDAPENWHFRWAKADYALNLAADHELTAGEHPADINEMSVEFTGATWKA